MRGFRKRLWMSALSVATAWAVAATPAVNAAGLKVRVSPNQVGFNTQDPYFVGSSALDDLLTQINHTGAKWVRATLYWDLMEPTKGTIDWSVADGIFNAIKAHGLNYDMVIRSAPSWAANGADSTDHNAAVTNGPAFEQFCNAVAKRYLNRGVRVTFEIGNEENMQFFSMPEVNPKQYTKDMLIPGYNGIRKAAKQLHVLIPTVLVGGFAPVSPEYVPNSVAPLDFMKGIYANGGKGHFSTIAYHTYTYVTAPDPTNFTFTQLDSIIQLMNHHGDPHKRIWATEVGWATGSQTGEISEQDQATFTDQEFNYWFSLPYAGPMIWYELIDNNSMDDSNRENTFGLMYSSPWTGKPAYKVFLSHIAKPSTKAAAGQ